MQDFLSRPLLCLFLYFKKKLMCLLFLKQLRDLKEFSLFSFARAAETKRHRLGRGEK